MSALPETRARRRIDEQLLQAGWVIQDRGEMNRKAGVGVAVREFPLAAGPCDYLLLVDGRACGVIEAKPAGTTLSGVAEQAAWYQAGLPPALARWGEPLRFDYEATGEEVLFSDRADPLPRSRRLFGFHRPETLLEWLRAGSSFRARLQGLPPLDRTGLRACQVEAIEGIEKSLREDKQRALVRMATGAGKTFTAATLCYRLLAHGGAKRILFLVDRNNLGRQTAKEFQGYKPPGTGRLFTELYNVQRLGPGGLDPAASVVISTIQRVWAQLTGEALDEAAEEESAARWQAPARALAYNAAMPVEAFDLIVVDECHRSIYGSWRQLLDYFDAHVIGLTATPTLHTMGFFGENLVADYPYERSVADGVNVPFEVFRVRTQIGEHGGRVEKGWTLPVRDKRTRAQAWLTLDDDLVYSKADLDRSVVARNQIRTVLQVFRDTLPTELFPGRTEVPKTLIFAKDDHHAEEIVAIAREVFGRGNEFAKKITYRVGAKQAEELIARFRNSYEPRIAVTVDMIATGTDVRAIEALVFLRDVQSRTYFEQMRGRGVRSIAAGDLRRVTPDAAAKDRFVVVDAVGVTERPDAVTAPLERERSVSFEALLQQVAAGREDEAVAATLAGRLAMLDRKLDDAGRARVAAVAGATPAQLAAALVAAIDPDAVEAAALARHGPGAGDAQREAVAAELRVAALLPFNDPAVRRVLGEQRARAEVVIDEISPDVVISSAYDPKAAGALVDRWGAFLHENRDRLAALTLLYGQAGPGARLRYAELEALRDAMLQPPWLLEPLALWSAYRRLHGARVRGNPARTLTDIIALVRFAVGAETELTPFAMGVVQRYNLWLGRERKAGRVYGAEALGWLELIRDYLAANVEMGVGEVQEAFGDRGGVVAARRVFGGDRLAGLLDEMAVALVG